MKRYAIASPVLGALLMFVAQSAFAGAVLDRVTSAAQLSCGINVDEDDYSKSNRHGNLAALGADFCRAVAAAVIGGRAKITVTPFPDEAAALRAVKEGKIALLVGVTPTPEIGMSFDVGFGPPLFYDGQGFLVAARSGITKFDDLRGKQICFIAGTDFEEALRSAFATRHIDYLPFPFEERGEMEVALATGHCKAITGDVSYLANIRRLFRTKAKDFVILPNVITRDPFVPAFPQGDVAWHQIVDAVTDALIEAEEAGVTGANLEAMKANGNRDVKRLLGVIPGGGKALGLDDGWAARAIAAVGNYGEIYDRDVGQKSLIALDRGRNALWNEGGLVYAYPLR